MDGSVEAWLNGHVHSLWVVVVGAFTGLLGGLFGKGGSAIATPLLALGGVHPFAALASPLPATIPATLVAARAYRAADLIDMAVLRTTVLVGLPATVVGALLSSVIGGGALVAACDVVVGLLGARILLRRRAASDTSTPSETETRVAVLVGAERREPMAASALSAGGEGPAVPVAAVGLLVGLASGLLANSGGFLLAPLFATSLRMPIKRALGTSLAAAAALAVPGTIVHAALGHIDWSVAIPFGLASVPLSAFGARLALRTEANRLEVVYGLALLTLGAVLLIVR